MSKFYFGWKIPFLHRSIRILLTLHVLCTLHITHITHYSHTYLLIRLHSLTCSSSLTFTRLHSHSHLHTHTFIPAFACTSRISQSLTLTHICSLICTFLHLLVHHAYHIHSHSLLHFAHLHLLTCTSHFRFCS